MRRGFGWGGYIKSSPGNGPGSEDRSCFSQSRNRVRRFLFSKRCAGFCKIADKVGCDFSLLKEVEKINKRRIEQFVEKVRKELWVLRDRKIALWGLAFKPNTDDVRFAPSLEIARSLIHDGAKVSAYDPQANEKARAVLPDVRYCANPYDAARGAEAVLVVTEWEEFRRIDWQRLRGLVDRPLVIDGRNCLDSELVAKSGFHYVSIGRAAVTAESVSSTERVIKDVALELTTPKKKVLI